MAGVDHQPFVIWLFDQDLQQLFPDPLVLPADKTAVRVAPSAVIQRQIPPRRARAQNLEHRIDKEVIVLGDTPQAPSRPGRCGSSKAQVSSEIS